MAMHGSKRAQYQEICPEYQVDMLAEPNHRNELSSRPDALLVTREEPGFNSIPRGTEKQQQTVKFFPLGCGSCTDHHSFYTIYIPGSSW